MDIDNFDHLLIKDFENWKVQLYSNQAYLGRCVIIYKGSKTDLTDTTIEELTELHTILNLLKNSLEKAFNPTRFNYICNGNKESKLHLHIFPRYESSRTFEGVLFEDKNWGKKPYPYDTDFEIEDVTMKLIIEEIKSNLYT